MDINATTKSLCLLSVLVATPALTHHSSAPLFDIDAIETHEGIVQEVWFHNPHVRYYVDAASEGEEPQIWEIETHNVSRMLMDGWDETTLQVGDHIEFSGHRARNGARSMLARIISKGDMELMRWERGPANAVALD